VKTVYIDYDKVVLHFFSYQFIYCCW